MRANLSGTDLANADLRRVDLSNANFSDANLRFADFYEANLQYADFNGANLRGASLKGADLKGANLTYADLKGANLRGANLRGVDLCGANLQGADLSNANLPGADLSGANLTGVKYNKHTAFFAIQCPEEGAFTAWKKCENDVMVKLLIPEDAKRSSDASRECRASKAIVLEVIGAKKGISRSDKDFVYEVGKEVVSDSFNDDRWNECAHGIHFFLTRGEAERD